jgi:hypothetical protein
MEEFVAEVTKQQSRQQVAKKDSLCAACGLASQFADE